jgi:hypothetical protein
MNKSWYERRWRIVNKAELDGGKTYNRKSASKERKQARAFLGRKLALKRNGGHHDDTR